MFLTGSPKFRTALVSGSLAVMALCGVMAGEAQARIFIGVGVPLYFPGFVVPPPAYYPPYYPPPMGYPSPGNTFSYTPPSAGPQSLAPPGSYSPTEGYSPPGYNPPGGYTPSMGEGPFGSAQSCQAGAYVCPLVADTPPGGACSCPGNNGQRIRGQAN
jgi:hypothetical protein